MNKALEKAMESDPAIAAGVEKVQKKTRGETLDVAAGTVESLFDESGLDSKEIKALRKSIVKELKALKKDY